MDSNYHACFEIVYYTREHQIKLETYFLNQENNCSYLVYGYKAYETEIPRLEGYIQWTIPMQYQLLEGELNAQFRMANSSSIENINRCKGKSAVSGSLGPQSDSDMSQSYIFTEMGTSRDIGGAIARGRANGGTNPIVRRWVLARKYAKDGNFMSIDPEILIKYYNNLVLIHEENRVIPADLNGELQNLWIWGPSGSGKSRLARMIATGEVYPKNKNKYWHNYKGEDWVIIEDVEINDQWIGSYLRIWGDRYRFNAELKMGSKVIRPKHILVTSSYSINEVFSRERMSGCLNMLDGLRRRFDSESLLRHGNEPVSIERLTEMRDERWKNWGI